MTFKNQTKGLPPVPESLTGYKVSKHSTGFVVELCKDGQYRGLHTTGLRDGADCIYRRANKAEAPK